MAGGAAASRSSRRKQAAAQQQVQASQGDGLNAAYKSCMMGRGYTAHRGRHSANTSSRIC
jgi:hypothetical protein